ncbi:MAG: hypothetical protein WBC44_00275 [Planctomycetaceae bacterium]
MRAGRIQRAILVTSAALGLALLAGCRVPGASFGTEPLQLRFAAATRQAIDAKAAERAPQLRPAVPSNEPKRESLAEPAVLVANEARDVSE